MMRSLFSAVSGLKSNQTAMDVIGNNIANVNTVAYKTSRTVFQDIFSQTVANATAPTAARGGSNPKQVGLGVTISTIGLNMTEGSTQSTNNPLDFAIDGEGMFVVSNGNGGYYYTRNGAFQLDKEGYLVTANGDYVMGVTVANALEQGATDGIITNPAITDADAVVDAGNPLFTKIQITGDFVRYVDDDDDPTTPAENDDATPATPDPASNSYGLMFDTDGSATTTADQIALNGLSDYAIGKDGTIEAMTEDGQKVQLGRLVLATFDNPSGLQKAGNSYYTVSANSGDPDYKFVGTKNSGTLTSGSLEMSNVDLSNELTNMIITQRGFQANSRVITTTDSMLEELVNLKR